jgi:dipeptidyl aminopeptidase/acylaminoacyl peptidase
MCFAAAVPACTDGGDSTSDDDAVTPWESAVTTTDDGAIVIQKVSYRSSGLRIYGQVCRPAGAGRFPLIVANHGGTAGLGGWNAGECAEAARAGNIQIESAFRGQDGSEGFVELCLGEVDDTLRMLDIALTLPEVDPSRVVMWGAGLGGCITTRAVQRGAKVKAAASVAGISNMRAAYEFWQSQLNVGSGSLAVYQRLIDLSHAGIGGTPDDYPEEYLRRSTLEHAAEMPAGVSYLMAHGVLDALVPTRQSCELAQKMAVQGHHFDALHQLVSTTPLGCEQVWTTSTAQIGSWAGARYLLAYDGVSGVLEGVAATTMTTDVEGFLSAKLR